MEVKIKNNKFWVSLVFLMVTMGVQAQMTKSQYKNEKKLLVKFIAEKQNDSLACENEKKRLDSLTTELSQRTFRLTNPKYVEEKFLSHYADLNILIADSVNVRDFFKWLTTESKSDHVDAYLKVLDMAASLDNIYDGTKNKKYREDIAYIKNKKLLYPKHHKGFDILASNVKDYNFVMFELSRVFDIVDKNEKNRKKCTYANLHDSGETKFIDNIPYAKRQLKDYINDSKQRKAIRVKLKEACPEAF